MAFFKTLAFVLLVVYVSHVYTGMQEEADDACKAKPQFYEGTKRVVNNLGAALNMPVGDGTGFDKAHVVPTGTMRTLICGQFADFKDEDKISDWKSGISDLITRLHTIDQEWKDLNTLKQNHNDAWKKFVQKNKDNKKSCEDLLNNIDDDDARSDEEIAKNLKALLKCANSAPANLRVGHARTNNAIGNELDPILKRPVADDHKVTKADLTSKSKQYDGELGLEYKKYADGGIMTSDQPYRG
ncbi:uncharacterized protein LOC130625822 [Hydractinia symbiolongicarpus]|uniref:uncharacterized protein LOC130625822 n=1 Tax=Hydractinia symbiolongicarpus TaxID=13093 RepID=UPI002549E39C|nr:uncharacterized protein LOC130625822 [Hydractinia symbiolongicarpus]